MSKELLTEILEAVQGESRHSSTGLMLAEGGKA